MSALPLYQIVDWDKWFENAKSRTVTKPQFVCVPNKHGGTGLSNIQGETDGSAIYGIWMWVLQVCSRQAPKREGYLTDDGKKNGRRLGARELANMFRRPIDEIHRAFQVLQSPEVAFIKLLEGYPEFITEVGEGHRADTPVSAVSENKTTPHGYLPDTEKLPSDHSSKSSAVTERRNEGNEVLSQSAGESLLESDTEQAAGGHLEDTGQVVGGYHADTAASGGDRTDDGPNETNRSVEGLADVEPQDDVIQRAAADSSRQDAGEHDRVGNDVIQHAEAKRLFGDLALTVFGKTVRETQWPSDLEHHLDAALPLERESWLLIDWFYRVPEEHPILSITMRRQSFESLIRNLGEETQKIRSARKKIGLNGISETGNRISESDEWSPARKKVAGELYGDRELPALFSQMPASARNEIIIKTGERKPESGELPSGETSASQGVAG
jgi:hypothetical protein